jgi:hypothetical protein
MSAQPFAAVEFGDEHAMLRGRLYLPHRLPAPAVVMAHGFSATVPMVLDRFAEGFARSGVAALAYDHPGFGTSDGQPRCEINRWLQARGYRSAITYARARDEIDPDRIAIWGDSNSGATALGVAAWLGDAVAAVVVQMPACGREVTPDDPDGARFASMVEILERGEIRLPRSEWVEKPVVSADQVAAPSALTPLTAFRWFIEYGARYGSGWQNRVTITERPGWDHIAVAANVRAHTLFMMSPDDEFPGAASSVQRVIFERLAGPKELVEMDGGHLGILWDENPLHEQAVAIQSAFLVRVLRVTTADSR